MNNERIFVTSDHHFFHNNIIKYCNRPFVSVQKMHEFMIDEWNSVVQKDSIVIHLGDFICGGSLEEVKEITDRLNGYKILIQGNHDRRGISWFKEVGFDRVFKRRWNLGQYCFSHDFQRPEYLAYNKISYNLHGHSHKHDYGHPWYNFCVDVVGYKPKKVKTNLKRSDFLENN